MSFKINDVNFLTDLIEKVYQYNLSASKKGKQVILLFFEKTLNMMSAASRIQCAFRLYLWKKKQIETPLVKIMRRRGSVTMQRGWRKWVLQHRLKALIRIKNICLQVTEPEFYLETNVYLNLRKIIDFEHKRWRFEEQYINFEVSDGGRVYGQVFFSKTERYNFGSIIPKWYGFDIPVKNFGEIIDVDPYELVHKHSHTNTKNSKIASIVSYSDIAEHNKITGLGDVNNLHFVKVPCDSVSEAKRRVAILGLVSYNVRNHTFIRGFGKPGLLDPFFFTGLKNLLTHCKIESHNIINHVKLFNVSRYAHSGLILDADDRANYDNLCDDESVSKTRNISTNINGNVKLI
jgi:hypothetical protein